MIFTSVFFSGMLFLARWVHMECARPGSTAKLTTGQARREKLLIGALFRRLDLLPGHSSRLRRCRAFSC